MMVYLSSPCTEWFCHVRIHARRGTFPCSICGRCCIFFLPVCSYLSRHPDGCGVCRLRQLYFCFAMSLLATVSFVVSLTTQHWYPLPLFPLSFAAPFVLALLIVIHESICT